MRIFIVRLFHFYYCETILIDRNYAKPLTSKISLFLIVSYKEIKNGEECRLIEREIYSRRLKTILERLVYLSQKGNQ